MSFRNDINGLRAVAVIAVVFFHFNAQWIPGGFSGVDVFFVVSGFLMTGIIFKGLDRNNFSIFDFYIARANRIIPALTVLCLTLLFLGLFFLAPLDYKALGKHAGSSVSFISNIVYWRESGYFDTSSYGKWLLHTWSLSVEWQFYIIYPLILVSLKRYLTIDKIKIVVVLGAVFGFVFCVIFTYKWPNPSYYLLPTRAWEMMVGGVAYLYPFSVKESRKKIYEYLGLTLIFFSYFFFTKEDLWPGYLALFPVLGSVLVIQAQRNNSFITNNFLLQRIGAWSYSIYLWHWPLVVTICYFSLDETFIFLGLFLSVFLGFLSYRYVEQLRFKRGFHSLLDFLKYKPLYVCVFICIYCLFVYSKLNLIYDIPKNIYDGMVVDKNTDGNSVYTWKKHRFFDKKNKFEEKPYKVLIVGDSQSADLVNMMYENGINDDVDVVVRKVPASCGAFNIESKKLDEMMATSSHGVNSIDINRCKKFISRVKGDDLIKDADIIFVSMSWRNEYVPYVLKSISNLRIRNTAADIYVIGGKAFKKTVPHMIYESHKKNIDLEVMAYGQILDEKDIDYFYQNKVFQESQYDLKFKYINMTNVLCENDKCFLLGSEGYPFYYDVSHLTRIGAKHIGEKLKREGYLPSYLFD